MDFIDFLFSYEQWLDVNENATKRLECGQKLQEKLNAFEIFSSCKWTFLGQLEK
jgi:hypothetical protein